jgi:hypothetical protein
MLSRVLILAGAAATVLSAFLTWVTVRGLGVVLDLGPIGAQLGIADGTVAGTDTSLWPGIVAVGVLAGVLGLLGVARNLLIVLGIATTLAGGALVYYMANVVDIETRNSGELESEVADALIDTTVGLGTPLLLAGGVLILVGALARR